jgi:hypothetical protein
MKGKGIPQSKMAQLYKSLTIERDPSKPNNSKSPISKHQSRSKIRSKRDKAYLLLQTDQPIDWESLNEEVGYIVLKGKLKGTFFTLASNSRPKNNDAKVVGTMKWENLAKKGNIKHILVKDIIEFALKQR